MPKEKIQDPWPNYESSVEKAIRGLQDKNDCFRDLIHDGTEAQKSDEKRSDFVRKQYAEMEKCVSDIELDIDLLKDIMNELKEHPERHDLTAVEVQRRQERINYFSRRIDSAKVDMSEGEKYVNNLPVKVVEAGRHNNHSSHIIAQNNTAKGHNPHTSIGMSQVMEVQRQKEEQKQDELLDEVFVSVQGAHQKGKIINAELDEQDKIINEIDKDMDTLQGKLAQHAKSVDKLLEKTSDKGKLTIIAMLMCVLVVMIMLLFN